MIEENVAKRHVPAFQYARNYSQVNLALLVSIALRNVLDAGGGGLWRMVKRKTI
jgi:hypothetical protein